MHRFILLVLLMGFALPAQAQDDAVSEEELKQLGESPEPPAPLQATNPSFIPDMSFILDVSLAGFSAPAQPTGAHDPDQNGFNFRQLEWSLGSVVDPYFRMDGNLVFSQEEGVEIEEIYATTLGLPFDLQARAGQFLTRFGRINPTHPHSWDFLSQPLVIGKFFGGEGNRGVGGELSWLSPLPWYAEVMASATQAGGAETARSFFGASDPGVQGVGDFQYTTTFKQFWPLSDDWSLAWGLSGAFGPNATARGNRSEVYGSDLYLKYRPVSEGDNITTLSLSLEGLHRRRQIPGSVLADTGGYASLFWRFAQNWGTALRYELVTGNAGDDLDPEWTGNRQRASSSLTYWATEFSSLRLEAQLDSSAWRPQPSLGLFLGFEALIGAHGAHTF